jgi:phosphoheptose isomerase
LSIFTITGTVHKKGGGKMDDIEYDDGFTLDEAMRVVKELLDLFDYHERNKLQVMAMSISTEERRAIEYLYDFIYSRWHLVL